MAVDYFLKIAGIDGESQSQGFENQIKIESFSWGGSQHSAVAGTGGSGAGKVNLADLSIMKTLDKASLPLFKSMCKGDHIATATLSAVKSGANGKPYLTVDLTEIFVTSLQESASSEIPMESVSFSYNQIKIQYSTQDEKGNLTVANSVTYVAKTNVTT